MCEKCDCQKEPRYMGIQTDGNLNAQNAEPPKNVRVLPVQNLNPYWIVNTENLHTYDTDKGFEDASSIS